MAKFGEICRMIADGDWIESKDQSDEGIRLIQTGNIGNGQYLDKPEKAKYITLETFNRLQCKSVLPGDILISRLPDPVGRACEVPQNIGQAITAVDCTIVRLNSSICNDRYFLNYTQSQRYFHELQTYLAGTTRTRISRKNLEKIEVPLPSLDEQRHIAAVLDKVTDLIAQRRAQLDKLDLLVKSRFVEMFGDPVDNSRGWDTIKLKDIGTCKNGMNFHTDNFGVKIHCLGVADFKDKSFIEGTSQLAVISLNEMPTEEYLLKNRDIVFVRSNGNKSLVGRSVMVYPGATPTTFSGFCIRFRLQSESLRPIYLLRVLKTDSVRKKLAGRGANIQNLNQKILLELSVPIPPLELQDSFENFEKRIVQLRAPVRQSLNRLEILKISLMQQYFG